MKKKRVKQITEIINQSNEKKKNKKIKSKGHGLKKTSEEIPQETGSQLIANNSSMLNKDEDILLKSNLKSSNEAIKKTILPMKPG